MVYNNTEVCLVFKSIENTVKSYIELWSGLLVCLIALLIYPIVWLLSQLLPYGITCLFTGMRVKKGYRYFYFLPRFIKELTKPLRRKENKNENE